MNHVLREGEETAYRYSGSRCRNGRGIHKRIDENRELMELLQTTAPALLRECPWVEGWIHSQDHFLVAIEFKEWRVRELVMQERHALQIARGDFSPTTMPTRGGAGARGPRDCWR
ncbi:hypothetical protein [Acidithiobacillus sp.]